MGEGFGSGLSGIIGCRYGVYRNTADVEPEAEGAINLLEGIERC